MTAITVDPGRAELPIIFDRRQHSSTDRDSAAKDLSENK